MRNNNIDVAILIRTIRESSGLTQKMFGEKLGVSKKCIGNWENGRRNLSIEKLEKIADIFGYSINLKIKQEDNG